jgi:hypothetical protein
VKRAALSPWQKVRAYVLLLPWAKKHFRRMMKDLLIAADQILFNYQNRRAARRMEKRKPGTQAKSDVEFTEQTREKKRSDNPNPCKRIQFSFSRWIKDVRPWPNSVPTRTSKMPPNTADFSQLHIMARSAFTRTGQNLQETDNAECSAVEISNLKSA